MLVDHATGAASRHPGWLEVMVDKRTMNDDARGMGEGVLDSRATLHRYTLLLEPRSPRRVRKQDSLPFLSLLALTLSRYLEHPPSSLLLKENDSKLKNSTGNFLVRCSRFFAGFVELSFKSLLNSNTYSKFFL